MLATGTNFLERDQPLKKLSETVHNLENSGGKIALVTGEAGRLKSRLVQYFFNAFAPEQQRSSAIVIHLTHLVR